MSLISENLTACDELSKFIDGYLSYLSEKYKVPKPNWRFSIAKYKNAGAYFNTIRSTIYIYKILWVHRYKDNPTATTWALKFYLAHEFYHYISFLSMGLAERGIPRRMWDKFSLWSLRTGEQQRADDFAYRETGIHILSLRLAEAIYLEGL